MFIFFELIFVDLLSCSLNLPIPHNNLIHTSKPPTPNLINNPIIILKIPIFHFNKLIPFNFNNIKSILMTTTTTPLDIFLLHFFQYLNLNLLIIFYSLIFFYYLFSLPSVYLFVFFVLFDIF